MKRNVQVWSGWWYLVSVAGAVLALVVLSHIIAKSGRASYGVPIAFVATNVDKAAKGQRIEASIEGEQNVGNDWTAGNWDPGQEDNMVEKDVTFRATVTYIRAGVSHIIEAVPKTVEYDKYAPIMFKVCCSGTPDEGGIVQPTGCSWEKMGEKVKLQGFPNKGWEVDGDIELIRGSLESDIDKIFVFKKEDDQSEEDDESEEDDQSEN